MRKSLKFLALLLAAALLFTSCGDIMGMIGLDGLIPADDPDSPSIELGCDAEQSVHYGEAVTLSVTASVDDEGTLSYQWWSGTTGNFDSASKVTGATSASYSFTAGNAEAKKYYWCEVTNSLNGKISKEHSNSVYVKTSNIVILDTYISSSTTLNAEYTYYVRSGSFVDESALLTIPAGTVLKFDEDNNFGTTDSARIKAEGTLAQPVIFTSAKDNSVGIQVMEGTPAAGDWNGISITGANGSSFTYCDFRYAGNSNGYGTLYIEANTTVDHCKFYDNASSNEYEGALNLFMGPSSVVTNNVFYNNEWPLSFRTDFNLGTGNCFHKIDDPSVKNTHQAIYLYPCDIESDKTVTYAITEVPYLVHDINLWGSLTVNTDVIVRFLDDGLFEIREEDGNYGSLTLNGIFTSFKDDAHGGDIGDDGTDAGDDGDWQGVYITGDSWNNSFNNDEEKVLFENPDHTR